MPEHLVPLQSFNFGEALYPPPKRCGGQPELTRPQGRGFQVISQNSWLACFGLFGLCGLLGLLGLLGILGILGLLGFLGFWAFWAFWPKPPNPLMR